MMGPKCEREGIGQNVLRHRRQTDTTPFALPFIGGVVLAVHPVGYPRISLPFMKLLLGSY